MRGDRLATVSTGKRVWRTLVRSLALSLTLPLALAGCGFARQGGPTEIVYWTGWSGHELEVLQGLVDEFNRTHSDVHVRMLTQFNTTGSYQKVRIAFAGGATPDVMSTVWDYELAAYAKRGVLEPLDGYLAKSGRDLDREYTPGVAKMVRVDGRVWGLTITTNTIFIAYNKALYRQAGLNPDSPPTTTDELDRAALACTQYDSSGRFVRYGFLPSSLSLWAYVFGGRWYDDLTGAVTANDPANVAALTWMASYRKRYDLRRVQAFQSTFGGESTANGPFFMGKIAMWQTGEWSEEFIRRYAPTLEWGWFALPAPPGGRKNTTSAGGSVFVIPAACRHKAAAWEFLNWMTSAKPVAEFCWSIKNVPPLIASGRDPRFQRDPLFRFAIGIQRGPNAFGAPPIAIWPTYRHEIDRVEESVMFGGADPKAQLDRLQANMTRELSRTREELRQ